MRYKVNISYDGTNYLGFQAQPHKNTIQDTIEKALMQILHLDQRIIMASRTDAGVHALDQVFHFDINEKLDCFRLKGSFNAVLPKDIHVNNVEEVDESFHARFSVKSKTYIYLINYEEFSPFLINRAYQCKYHLDVEKMRECSRLFLGEHDFSSFSTSTYEEKPDQRRTIYDFEIINENGNLLIVKITGDGFLRNMVRIIVGSLIEVGRGKKNISDVEEMLNNPCKSTRRYNIVPYGLYLARINYN